MLTLDHNSFQLPRNGFSRTACNRCQENIQSCSWENVRLVVASVTPSHGSVHTCWSLNAVSAVVGDVNSGQVVAGVQLDGVVVGGRSASHRIVIWRLLLHHLVIRWNWNDVDWVVDLKSKIKLESSYINRHTSISINKEII